MVCSGIYLLIIGVDAVPSRYRFIPIVLDWLALEEYHKYVAHEPSNDDKPNDACGNGDGSDRENTVVEEQDRELDRGGARAEYELNREKGLQ